MCSSQQRAELAQRRVDPAAIECGEKNRDDVKGSTGGKKKSKRWVKMNEKIHTLGSGDELGRYGRLHLCQFFLVFCPRLCRAIEAVLHLFSIIYHRRRTDG